MLPTGYPLFKHQSNAIMFQEVKEELEKLVQEEKKEKEENELPVQSLN